MQLPSKKEVKLEGVGAELTLDGIGAAPGSVQKLIIKKSPALKRISVGVFPKLTALTVLSIEKSALEELPADFGQAAALEEVTIADGGSLRFLPASAGQLKKLKKLHIKDTGFVALPLEMAGITTLKDVDLLPNPVVLPPPYILRIGAEAVRNHLTQLATEDTKRKAEEKMNVVKFEPFITDDQSSSKKPMIGPENIWNASKLRAYWVPLTSTEQFQGKRPYQEDRVSQELMPLQGGGHAWVFSVFDGHAGAECADYLTANFHKILAARADFKIDTLELALKGAYADAEKAYLEIARPKSEKAGSTAVTAVIAANKMVLAWVGDCRATMASGNQAVRLTTDHNCRVATERARVESVGGKIETSDEGTMRVNGRIAITRAFGDIKLKEPTPFVIADPEMKNWWLSPRDSWLVLGSDGMWDYVTEHDAREWCTKLGTPKEVTARLMKRSKDANGRDNSTALVIQLQWIVKPASP